MGYSRAGFEVVGVDSKPQPRYPFEFHQADAMTFDVAGFDVVHASPPCQGFSAATKTKAGRVDLLTPTRERLIEAGVSYVLENVPRAPMRDPIRLCGSMFGLRVRRHRLFESNVTLTAPRCDHGWQNADPIFRIYEHGYWTLSGVARVYGIGGGKEIKEWPEAMGIHWMTYRELAQAVPPAYTLCIGQQLMAAL